VDGGQDEAAWESAARMEILYEWTPGENVPAPVNTYNATVHAMVESLFAALSHVVPARARADGCGSRSIIIGGRSTSAGKAYVQYEIVGGAGAAPADGASGTSVNQSNAKIASITKANSTRAEIQ
jgi:N-methylhydantoinase B/oxoprolinase/acetone carboxylase alpha subunit